MFGYKHLKGYLERYTVLRIWRLHIRLHRIKRPDITPFLHTHPFHYISFILWGGYTEVTNSRVHIRSRWSMSCRHASTPHRIVSVDPNTVTFFITWSTAANVWKFVKTDWKFITDDWVEYEHGIYRRVLYGETVYSKFNEYWYKAATSIDEAHHSTLASIDQSTTGQLVERLRKSQSQKT